MAVGLFNSSLLLREEASLMMIGKGTGSYFVDTFLKGQLYPGSLGYLISGSWSPKQCQAWSVSHGVRYKQGVSPLLPQVLLADRTSYGD